VTLPHATLGVALVQLEPSLVQTFPLVPGAGKRGSTAGPRTFGLTVTATFCPLETVTVIGAVAFGVKGVTDTFIGPV
jgi:hypothetical protein